MGLDRFGRTTSLIITKLRFLMVNLGIVSS